MGSNITKTDVSSKAVHRSLRLHPNFVMPEAPKSPTVEQAVKFAIEAIARYVSPPKIEGEDEEFACIDVATAIREQLGPELLEAIKGPPTSGWAQILTKGRYHFVEQSAWPLQFLSLCGLWAPEPELALNDPPVNWRCKRCQRQTDKEG
jgi:hypothetical protein